MTKTPLDGAGHVHHTCAIAAVADSVVLLYHAAEIGKPVPVDVRQAILGAKAADQALTTEQEAGFLEAYGKLAALMAPVSAATLRATSNDALRSGWPRGVRLSLGTFGMLAVVLLIVILLGEFTRTFIGGITTAKAELEKAEADHRRVYLAVTELNEQIRDLEASLHEPRLTAKERDDLTKRRDELTKRRREQSAENDRLFARKAYFSESIQNGYNTLTKVVPLNWLLLRDVTVTIGTMIGAFVLPVLYGALGTTTFILRRLHDDLVNRSLDPRRRGEYVVRIFLGMLSGVTLQWIFVRDAAGIPGGITPAVLAFLGGYSVELLFSAADRLLAALTDSRRRPDASG